MNAYRETICSCWLPNRRHCVFCSLIKFHVTLPVWHSDGRGLSARSGLMTVTGGWHQWRARTPWPNISELPFNAEPIANRRLHHFLALVLLTHVLLVHGKVSYFIFGHPTLTFILYFKHMSPAPCLRLTPRWKVKFVIFLVSPSVDGQICNAKTEVILNGLSQKEITLHQSAPADICCHFNLSPLLISALIYSCNDVMNGIVGDISVGECDRCLPLPLLNHPWLSVPVLGMGGPLGAIHLCDACLNRGMNIKHVLSSINIDDIDIIVTVMRTFVCWRLEQKQ